MAPEVNHTTPMTMASPPMACPRQDENMFSAEKEGDSVNIVPLTNHRAMQTWPTKCGQIIAAVDRSTLQSKHLAKTLLTWALEPMDHVPPMNNLAAFKSMRGKIKNDAMEKLVSLVCFFQYGYGHINSVPRDRNEKSLNSYKGTSREYVYSRAKELLDFVVANNDIFGDTIFDYAGQREDILGENLFDKLDTVKTNLRTEGLFDPRAETCVHASNCGGIYWGHYERLNRVVEGLKEAANSNSSNKLFFITESQMNSFLRSDNLLYDRDDVLKERAAKIKRAMRGLKSDPSRPWPAERTLRELPHECYAGALPDPKNMLGTNDKHPRKRRKKDGQGQELTQV